MFICVFRLKKGLENNNEKNQYPECGFIPLFIDEGEPQDFDVYVFGSNGLLMRFDLRILFDPDQICI